MILLSSAKPVERTQTGSVLVGDPLTIPPFHTTIKKKEIFLQTDSLSPVLEVDDVGSLQAHLQEIAQFYVLGGWARLWAAVLNTCRQGLQKGKAGVKKELNGRSKECDLSGMNKY